jgi:hypothetical protein
VLEKVAGVRARIKRVRIGAQERNHEGTRGDGIAVLAAGADVKCGTELGSAASTRHGAKGATKGSCSMPVFVHGRSVTWGLSRWSPGRKRCAQAPA